MTTAIERAARRLADREALDRHTSPERPEAWVWSTRDGWRLHVRPLSRADAACSPEPLARWRLVQAVAGLLAGWLS